MNAERVDRRRFLKLLVTAGLVAAAGASALKDRRPLFTVVTFTPEKSNLPNRPDPTVFQGNTASPTEVGFEAEQTPKPERVPTPTLLRVGTLTPQN